MDRTVSSTVVISLDESTVIYTINLLSGETWLQVVVGYPENRNLNAPFAQHCARHSTVAAAQCTVYRPPLFGLA